MKQHTAEFKQELINMGKEINSIITYEQDNETITLEEELYAVTPHYEANLLKSVMKQLDIETSVEIPLETVINYQLGVKVEDEYEYLNFGNYVVYQVEKQEDTDTYKIVCYDKLLYAMKQNESLDITYPITIQNYLNAIATKIGLTVATTNFYNKNLQIQTELYAGLEYTYRDILDEIAQATGSIILLNENDEIVLKYLDLPVDTLNEEYLKDINVKFGEKYGPINSVVLSRAGGSDNVYLRNEQSVIDNGLCEVKIVDNQIMNFNDRSSYLQGILTALNGIEYYLNDFSSLGILYLECGDFYNVTVGENTYKCLMLNDEINVTQGIGELIHTDLPEESETDYEKADKTDRRLNQTYIIVDKQNQEIQSVVTQTIDEDNPDSTVNKVSRLTQRVGELESAIQNIADITVTGETGFASVTLNNINESEPIVLKVHPTVNNISYLYPKVGLYPSDDLYMPDRKIRFVRTYDNNGTTSTENIDYELPEDLLYYNQNVYDEFYLNYDEEICQVIKRCQYVQGANLFNSKFKNYNNEIYCRNGTATENDGTYTFNAVSSSTNTSSLWRWSTSFNVSYDTDFGPLIDFTEDNYTISVTATGRTPKIYVTYFDENKQTIWEKNSAFDGESVTISKNDVSTTPRYFTVGLEWFYPYSTNTVKIMVNEGTTALPYDKYGSIYIEPLTQEVIHNYTYPTIPLGAGDYTVSLLGYEYGYLLVTLMVQNIYTTQFATKLELNSKITQTENSIMLEVNRKTNNDEIIASINTAIQDEQGIVTLTGNAVVIQSDNFTLTSDGKITATAGDIGGFSLNPTNFTGNLSGLYDYNNFDVVLVAMVLMNRLNLGSNFENILDVNNSR